MTRSDRVFIRIRSKTKIKEDVLSIYLEDVAQTVSSLEIEKEINRTCIYSRTKHEGSFFVIDAISILKVLQSKYPHLDFQIIGNEETLIEIEHDRSKKVSIIGMVLVWLILFIGSGLAILNFHTDVNMSLVHQRIYYLLTGKENEHPLLLQIPYSIGIGIGMIIFFNHLFRKRLNEEPSPLELEMYLYQENIEKYAKAHENKENRRGEHDH